MKHQLEAYKLMSISGKTWNHGKYHDLILFIYTYVFLNPLRKPKRDRSHRFLRLLRKIERRSLFCSAIWSKHTWENNCIRYRKDCLYLVFVRVKWIVSLNSAIVQHEFFTKIFIGLHYKHTNWMVIRYFDLSWVWVLFDARL